MTGPLAELQVDPSDDVNTNAGIHGGGGACFPYCTQSRLGAVI